MQDIVSVGALFKSKSSLCFYCQLEIATLRLSGWGALTTTDAFYPPITAFNHQPSPSYLCSTPIVAEKNSAGTSLSPTQR